MASRPDRVLTSSYDGFAEDARLNPPLKGNPMITLAASPAVSLRRVETTALRTSSSMSIPGEFVAVMGPSGPASHPC